MSVIASHLLAGERILWRGAPFTGLIFRPIEWFLIPLSLLWGGFAVFWNFSVWQGEAPLPFKLFGLPFLIAGVFFTVGRFLFDVMVRAKMTYAVTNRRVLIFKNKSLTSCRSLDVKRIPCIELEQIGSQQGTIRFGPASNFFDGRNFGIWSPSFDSTPQFIRIDNARSVYELIERQAKSP